MKSWIGRFNQSNFKNCKSHHILHSEILREHSSVGLEHLPYKQRVRGSNPCAPTNETSLLSARFFYFYPNLSS